jgi:hypothetical protein
VRKAEIFTLLESGSIHVALTLSKKTIDREEKKNYSVEGAVTVCLEGFEVCAHLQMRKETGR